MIPIGWYRLVQFVNKLKWFVHQQDEVLSILLYVHVCIVCIVEFQSNFQGWVMDSDDAESESPPSQVFRSNKKRVIKYDDEHSIKLTPPTSGPTLEASIHKSHEDTGEASSEFTGEDEFEEEEHDRPEERDRAEERDTAEEERDRPEEERDRQDKTLPASAISSLINLKPPGNETSNTGTKRKIMASSSTAFMPDEKKNRAKVPWTQITSFNTKEEYEQSDIFKKLK